MMVSLKSSLIKLSSVAIIASLMAAQSSVADDRDIYITDTATAGSTNHNILFVMDTSGSMRTIVAGISPLGVYDPFVDYGNSADKIYVYDADMNFTGDTIENVQNKCDALTNNHSFAAENPVYGDFALQWQQSSTVVDGGETCVSTGEGVTALSYPSTYQNISDREWVKLGDYEVEADKPFSVTLETDEQVDFWVSSDEYVDPYEIYCYVRVNGGSSYTCEDITVDFNDRLTIWVQRRDDKPTVSYTGSLGTETFDCTDNEDDVVDSSDWQSNFITTTDVTAILDCKNDRNIHGVNATSPADYITDCAFGDDCPNPTYTSSSSQEINWGAVPFRNFVPANYHDYRNSTNYVDPLIGLPSENPDTYCDSNSKLGDRFYETGTRNIYECFTRLGLMKNTVSRLVKSLVGSPINVGIMRFQGTIIDAVQSVATNTDFEANLQALDTSGGTPLSEVLYEAYLYYAGKPFANGRSCRGSGSANCTDDAARVDNTYISPVTDSCQKNNIVFLTDGFPSGDGDRDTEIKALADVSDCGDNCLDEMAGALATTDLNTSIPTDQIVKTYTIGLEADFPLLQQTADAGLGDYYSANDAASLESAFRNILQSILTDAASFASPSVAVNSFNELENRNEIYFAVFEPSRTPRWQGNVKKYRLSNGTVKDALGADAVDPATGLFEAEAQSIWSASADGNIVREGGASSKLSAARNMYTGFDNDGIPSKLASNNFSDISNDDIRASDNAERADFLNWLLGVDVYDDTDDDAAYFMGDPLHSRPIVVTYKGTNADDAQEVLFFATNLGTLHAIDPADTKGTEIWAHHPEQHLNNLRSYITAPFSNQHTYGLDGEITIVRTETATSVGTDFELDNVQLYIGERRGGSRYYGFDVSNARIAADPPLELDDSYTTPFKKLWTITGAIHDLPSGPAKRLDPASADTGFRDLGQTWSKLIPAKVKSNTEERDVFIFSGGYDPRHDDPTYSATNTASDYGNAIYIIDKLTGNLLYSIGNNSDDDDNDENTASNRTDVHDLDLPMVNSIVATPTVVDVDGDGYADTIFATDIMGHIWRIDLDKEKSFSATNYVTGGKIADLSSDTSITAGAETLTDAQLLSYGPRRFFNSVDVSRSGSNSLSDHLTIVVGTGYRAKPTLLETLNNKVFILFDDYPRKRLLGSTAEADRYKYVSETIAGSTVVRTITADDLLSADTSNSLSKSTAPYGIYRELRSGEKLLQQTLTFNNRIAFRTFNTTTGLLANACGGNLGSNATFILDINTGLSAIVDENEATNLENYVGIVDDDGNAVDGSGNAVNDENGEPIRFDVNGNRLIPYIADNGQGIPASISILFTEDGVTSCRDAICEKADGEDGEINIGDELMDELKKGTAYRTFWQEER
jgi:type IV pilus assembly protein PilY1